MRWRISLLFPATAVMAAAAVLVPAGAAPLAPPAPDPLPSIVFVARSDNPIDALAAGGIAGQVGGIVLLTPPNELNESTRQALLALDPDMVVLAGGASALGPAVFETIQSLLPAADVVRKSGTDRFATAVDLATVLEDLGVEGPVVAGAQREGDVWVGGTLTADDVVVPSGLDADSLGGKSVSDFAAAPASTTGIYRCTGDDFLPDVPSNTGFVRELSGALTDSTDGNWYRCIPHLPLGAKITALRMRVMDTATGSGLTSMGLESDPWAGGTGKILATIPDTGVAATPGGNVLLEDTSITDVPQATVSLDDCYQVWFGITTVSGSSRVGVYYADIEYTVPAVPGTPAP